MVTDYAQIESTSASFVHVIEVAQSTAQTGEANKQPRGHLNLRFKNSILNLDEIFAITSTKMNYIFVNTKNITPRIMISSDSTAIMRPVYETYDVLVGIFNIRNPQLDGFYEINMACTENACTHKTCIEKKITFLKGTSVLFVVNTA